MQIGFIFRFEARSSFHFYFQIYKDLLDIPIYKVNCIEYVDDVLFFSHDEIIGRLRLYPMLAVLASLGAPSHTRHQV